MTTFTNTHPFQQNNDAEFQEWVQAFIAGLAGVAGAGGLVQTADTGQIDPLTVARPATTATDAGYAVYRLDDAPQATNPVFLKFYFGTDASAPRPRIRLGIGTASDGAGVLTGEEIFHQALTVGSSGASASSYFCCVPGFLGISFFTQEHTSSARRYGLYLQRTTDAAGVPTDGGIATVVLQGSGASVNYLFRARTGATWDGVAQSAPVSAIACYPGNLTNFSVDADTEIVASFVKNNGLPMRVSPFLCFANGSDIGGGATFTTTLVGASATYIGTQNCSAAGIPWGSTTNVRYCMRWE